MEFEELRVADLSSMMGSLLDPTSTGVAARSSSVNIWLAYLGGEGEEVEEEEVEEKEVEEVEKEEGNEGSQDETNEKGKGEISKKDRIQRYHSKMRRREEDTHPEAMFQKAPAPLETPAMAASAMSSVTSSSSCRL